MLTVSLLTGNEIPFNEGVKFQLVSANDGAVLATGETDAQGVVSFDVDTASVGPVAIRRDREPVATP